MLNATIYMNKNDDITRRYGHINGTLTQFSISNFGEYGDSFVSEGISVDRTINFAAIDICFETRFEFNEFLLGPKRR